MKLKVKSLALLPIALVAGCVSVPSGPSVTAMQGRNKTYDQFRADDAYCRNEAAANNQSPSDAQANSVAAGAVIGTLVGAAAGAAIGGGRGAGVGAGTGLLVGTAAGASAGNQAAYGTQRRYDQWYLQCMYGHGESVPMYGRQQAGPAYASPPQASPPPPPPPGYGTPPDYVPPPAYPSPPRS